MEHASPTHITSTPNYGSTSSQEPIAGPSNPQGAIDHVTSSAPTDGQPEEASGLRRRRKLREVLEQYNPQKTLKNTGSVARDHLALERTWLAWTRTSLSIASTGVALVQLFALSSQNSGNTNPVGQKIMRVAKPLGAVVIAFAFLTLVVGSARFFRVQYALTQNTFPPARWSPLAMSAIMMCIVVAVFAVVVTLTR